MTITAIEALNELKARAFLYISESKFHPDWQREHRSFVDGLDDVVRAALTAPVGLEWQDNFLHFNGRHIGHSFKIGDQGAGYYLWSNQSVTGFETEAEARAALETAAREWLTPSLNKKG